MGLPFKRTFNASTSFWFCFPFIDNVFLHLDFAFSNEFCNKRIATNQHEYSTKDLVRSIYTCKKLASYLMSTDFTILSSDYP